MAVIELTEANIHQYLDDCVSVQKYLVTSSLHIEPQFFVDTAAAADSYFIGLHKAGHIVGLGVLSKIVHPLGVSGYVNNIVVHQAEQGHGYFGVLMNALEAKAVEWNCNEVALTCSRELVWRLYEKREYTEKQTRFYIKKLL